MMLFTVRPQVVPDDIGGQPGGQQERCFQRDLAFRTIGNWYHYDLHDRYSMQARRRGEGTVAEVHYINGGTHSPIESEV